MNERPALTNRDQFPGLPRPLRLSMPMNLARICLPILAFLAWMSSAAIGQDDEPAYSSWTKIEASEEMREYLSKFKKGELDDSAVKFLETAILPQLAAQKNVPLIERVRRRMREVVFNERDAAAATLEKANETAARSLTAMARNAETEPLVRINAMLLIGELRGKDGKPWAGAVPALTAAATDAKLVMAVRVAAAAGLSRHAEAARTGNVGNPTFSREIVEKLVAIVAAAPSPDDGAGGEWLVSRVIDILPIASPTASPQAAAALAKIVNDGSRPFDVRVRAAAALGATISAESKLDPSGIVAAIRGLAITALEGDLAESDERAWRRRSAGQMARIGRPTGDDASLPGGAPPDTDPSEPTIDPLMVRRNGWRLTKLADAILPKEGSGGLATLLAGPDKSAAEQISTVLRAAGKRLDTTPDIASVKDSLEKLEPIAGGDAPAAAAKPAAGKKPAEQDPFAAPGG